MRTTRRDWRTRLLLAVAVLATSERHPGHWPRSGWTLLPLASAEEALVHEWPSLEVTPGTCGQCAHDVDRGLEWLRYEPAHVDNATLDSSASAGALIGATLYTHVDFMDAGRWGNLIAPYWAGRCLAALGNVSFAAEGQFERTRRDPFLWFLPRDVPANSSAANCSSFHDACACGNWMFPSGCANIMVSPCREMIIADTRRALLEWGEYRGFENALQAAHELEHRKSDIVIHARCAADTWLAHGEYGPAAWSLYNATVPSNTTGVITIITELASAVNHPGCSARIQAMLRHLRRLAPHAERVHVLSGGVFEAYLTMVYAPTLIREVGTFSLWAALANAHGTIYSPRGCAPRGLERFVEIDAPVLYPGVAARLNITADDADIDKVIAWLESH